MNPNDEVPLGMRGWSYIGNVSYKTVHFKQNKYIHEPSGLYVYLVAHHLQSKRWL